MINKLRMFEAFSGYGSQSIALQQIGVPVEVVGISEIDKYAIKAYYSLHSESIPNFGDISLIDETKLPAFDLFTYSFPCTDISLSGKIEGIERGKTRSGLLYECERILDFCRPKYLLLENVKNLLGSKFKWKFDAWLDYLSTLGYSNNWFVLNSKDFGVSQNRERVFCFSILGETTPNFKIPLRKYDHSKFISELVSDKYYLDVSKYNVPLEGDFFGAIRGRYTEQKKLEQRLELRLDGLTNTITTVPKDNVFVSNGRLRYLTEIECLRLMGLNELYIEKLKGVQIPKTQLYKLAGNSIVIPVLEAIFENYFLLST